MSASTDNESALMQLSSSVAILSNCIRNSQAFARVRWDILFDRTPMHTHQWPTEATGSNDNNSNNVNTHNYTFSFAGVLLLVLLLNCVPTYIAKITVSPQSLHTEVLSTLEHYSMHRHYSHRTRRHCNNGKVWTTEPQALPCLLSVY